MSSPDHTRDRGISLVEVVVAIALFGMLSTVLLGFVLSTSRVTEHGERLTTLNEESRVAMERLTRELRQAKELLDVHLPTSEGDSTALTFWTDFNGNGAPDLGNADPEVLTYRWSPSTSRLTLTANDADGTAVTRPVLAGNVTKFTVDLRSSLWQYDADGDGITTWEELDSAGAGIGNGNGIPDDVELSRCDLVAVALTVTDGTHSQTYTTEIDMRNRNQS